MTEMEDVLSGKIKLIKMIIQNGTPIIGGGGFELKLFDPICHQSSAVVFWIANAMSFMDYWNIKSPFLDGVSSVGGVEDELKREWVNRERHRLLRAMTLPTVVEYFDVK